MLPANIISPLSVDMLLCKGSRKSERNGIMSHHQSDIGIEAFVIQ